MSERESLCVYKSRDLNMLCLVCASFGSDSAVRLTFHSGGGQSSG